MNLGRNILWNLGGFVWLTLLVFLVTPYMVKRLGLDAFGVWAVLTASSGYLTTLDLGLGSALVRFLATEHERKDRRALEVFLRSGLTLQLFLGGTAATVLFLAGPLMAEHWFRVPPELIGETAAAFRLCSLVVFLGFMIAGYAAVPASLRRFDLLTLRTVVFMTVQYGLFVLALYLNGGLYEVVVAYVVGSLITLVFLIAVASRLLPDCMILPGWDSAAVRTLFRFGRYKFIGHLSWMLMREFDRIALGLLLPVGRLPYYAIPVRLAQRVTQVVEQIAVPFYPSMSSQVAGARHEELQFQYRVGTRLVANCALGLVALLGGLAHPILHVWLGPDFAREGSSVLRILLLAYTASAFFTLPSVAADGAGHPGCNAVFFLLGGLIHVPLVLLGIDRMGLNGAALGVLAGYVITLMGVKLIHDKVTALPPLMSTLGETRGALLSGALTFFALDWISRTTIPSSGIASLILCILGGGVVFLTLSLCFRGIHLGDIRRVAALARRG